MKVEQLLEQMDKHIKVLNDSVDTMQNYEKYEVKEIYRSNKTYEQCLNMERGALTAMISLRQWIVNKNSVETHLETLEKINLCKNT